MSYSEYSFAAHCRSNCCPVKSEGSCEHFGNGQGDVRTETYGHSSHQGSTSSSVGRPYILLDIVGVGLREVTQYSSAEFTGKTSGYIKLTGSNGSLTSQTEVFEPTLNSRSSFVMAAIMNRVSVLLLGIYRPNLFQLTVPVLVDHHHAQQHTQRKDEYSVNVVRDGITDGVAERNHDDDPSDIEEDSEELFEGKPVSLTSQVRSRISDTRTISPIAHLSSSVRITRIN